MGQVQMVFKAETNRTYFRRVEEAIYEALRYAVERTIAHGVSVAKRHAPVRQVTIESRREGKNNKTYSHGSRVGRRDLTDAEIADLPDFAKKGLNPLTGNTYLRTGKRPQTVTKRSLASRERPGFRNEGRLRQSPAGFRSVKQSRSTGAFRAENPAFGGLLSVRGRYELKTGRAVSIKRTSAIERKRTRDPKTGKVTVHDTIRHGAQAQLGGTLKREIYGEMTSGGQRDGLIVGEVRSPTDYAQYVEFPTSRTAAQPYMRPARAAMEKKLYDEANRALEQVDRFAGGGK